MANCHRVSTLEKNALIIDHLWTERHSMIHLEMDRINIQFEFLATMNPE
jgi:hypothetical protein